VGALVVLMRKLTLSMPPAVTSSVATKVSLNKLGVRVEVARTPLPSVIVDTPVIFGAVWLTTVHVLSALESEEVLLFVKVFRSLAVGAVIV